jgi:23S rRNA pseudouridine1911/1915/1917 synthase
MHKEVAFKLLALQKNISNKKAKELIDRGLVFVGDKQLKIARAQIDADTKFRIEYPKSIEVLYEDEKVLVVNKPAQVDSYDIEESFKGTRLLHRLDRETSGVLLLGKEESFIKRAIEAFKHREVKKEYIAWVDGVVFEELEIDAPITTIKQGRAISKIDFKRGKKALTKVYPEEIQGKKSKVKVEIVTGRTHQIRLHLSYAGFPIVGDAQYGSRTKAKHFLLHASKVALLEYSFEAPEPKGIVRYK